MDADWTSPVTVGFDPAGDPGAGVDRDWSPPPVDVCLSTGNTGSNADVVDRTGGTETTTHHINAPRQGFGVHITMLLTYASDRSFLAAHSGTVVVGW